MEIDNLVERVNKLIGAKIIIEQNLAHSLCSKEIKEKELESTEHAREVVRKAAIATQETISFHIQDVVTLALASVFQRGYRFNMEFVERRGKTECDLSLVDHTSGERVSPLDATGGGVVDVVSFALRVAMWAMGSPRKRSVICLDEPFKHLSGGLLPFAGQMLKEISKRLKIQFIVITHDSRLMETADKVVELKKDKGTTKIKKEEV